MSFIADAINRFFNNPAFLNRGSTPATIPVSSAHWVVDPNTHRDLSIVVKGGLAHGRVRYAGLDSIPNDTTTPIHAKVETNVHVSHLDLAPLVTVEVQHANAEKGDQNQNQQWNLTITTPTENDVPKSVGARNAGIDVDVLVTIVPGSPSAETSTVSSFNSVKIETVNLAHSCVDTDSDSKDAGKDSAASLSPPQSGAPSKPAMASLDVSTANGGISLSPSRPWSVGRRLSVSSLNGSIFVSGPLHVQAQDDSTRIQLATTNGSVSSQVVGANTVESNSMNGRISSWAENVFFVKAESVNGSVLVHANEVPAGGYVSGSSVNGGVSVMAALAQAVEQVRLSASSTVGSVLAESRAAGWPEKSERPAKSFVGKKVVLDLDSLKEKQIAKVAAAQRVLVAASTVNGSAKAAIVNADEVLKV